MLRIDRSKVTWYGQRQDDALYIEMLDGGDVRLAICKRSEGKGLHGEILAEITLSRPIAKLFFENPPAK